MTTSILLPSARHTSSGRSAILYVNEKMSSLFWLPASSPLFSYAPSPLLPNASASSPWQGVLDPLGTPSNNTYKATSGSSAFILSSIYGRSTLFDLIWDMFLADGSASSFTPIWEESSIFNAGLTMGSAQPTTWTSGQNATVQGGLGRQSFQVDVQCSIGDCSSDSFKFHGGWIGTQYGPDGRVPSSRDNHR